MRSSPQTSSVRSSSSRRKRRVTMTEVARDAGVSQAAVSLVLNDKQGMIGEETRERILASARRLGYRLNYHARMLRTDRTFCLGLLAHMHGFAMDNYVFTGVARGAEDELSESNSPYALLAMAATWASSHDKSMELIERGLVDGVVCVVSADGLDLFERERLPWLRERGVACVAVHSLGERPDSYPYVGFDSRAGGARAAKHLAELGHASIGLFAFAPDNAQCRAIREGFEAGLAGAGKPLDARHVFAAPSGKGLTAFEAAHQWARDVPTSALPRAMLVTLDACAYGIQQAMQERGLRVPEDLALLGFDDERPRRYGPQTLSSIVHPFREKGRAAVRLLTGILDETWPETQAQQVVLQPELSVRASCGAQP